MNLDLDLSDKVSSIDLDTYKLIHEATESLGISYFLIGAHVRDLIMHLGHGFKARRATEDIDYAIEVKSWSEFSELKNMLISKGFTETNQEQSLISPNHIKIDIVPFGKLQDEKEQIYWPPKQKMVMSVNGFEAAHRRAIKVTVCSKTNFKIPVIQLGDMIIFKLISWSERASNIRNKDAQDIYFIISKYHEIPEASDILYASTELTEQYDFDMELVGAKFLGQKTKALVTASSLFLIKKFYSERRTLHNFMLDTKINSIYSLSVHQNVLQAFFDGFEPSIIFEDT
jgi:predicted nucleotidyltransferase